MVLIIFFKQLVNIYHDGDDFLLQQKHPFPSFYLIIKFFVSEER